MLSEVLGSILSTVSLTQVLVAVFITGLFIHWLINTSKRRKRNLPPGPPYWPLLGNVLDFRGSSLSRKTREWSEKYGPVVTFYIGLQPRVVICSIEALIESYVQKGPEFANKPYITSLDVISQGGKNIGFAPYSEALKYRRKIAIRALRQYMIGNQHAERIHDVVALTVANMEKEPDAFSPHSHLTHTVFNIIHSIAFGYKLALDDPNFQEVLRVMDVSSGNVTGFWEDWFPVLRYFPTKRFRKAMADIDFVLGYVRKHVDERREKFDENNVKTLADNIFLAQKEVEKGENDEIKSGFTDVHVGFILADVFFGGIDSTRATLEWIFLVLASNPEIQQKIQDEVDTNIGDAIPGIQQNFDLPYTEAVIMETMRMYPAVPVGLPHETSCDTEVAGCEIPAKTQVMVNQYAILHDPKHWENPETFMPERFIDETSGKLKPRPKSWIPFSVGARNCIGEFLGKKNILYTVAGILQKLSFELAPGTGRPDFTARDLWFSYICKPYKVIVTSRREKRGVVFSLGPIK